MWLPKFMIECFHQTTQLFQHFKVFIHESVEESLQKALLPKLSLTHFKVMAVKLPIELPLTSMIITDRFPSNTLKTSSLLPWGYC